MKLFTVPLSRNYLIILWNKKVLKRCSKNRARQCNNSYSKTLTRTTRHPPAHKYSGGRRHYAPICPFHKPMSQMAFQASPSNAITSWNWNMPSGSVLSAYRPGLSGSCPAENWEKEEQEPDDGGVNGTVSAFHAGYPKIARNRRDFCTFHVFSWNGRATLRKLKARGILTLGPQILYEWCYFLLPVKCWRHMIFLLTQFRPRTDYNHVFILEKKWLLTFHKFYTNYVISCCP